MEPAHLFVSLFIIHYTVLLYHPFSASRTQGTVQQVKITQYRLNMHQKEEENKKKAGVAPSFFPLVTRLSLFPDFFTSFFRGK